MKKAHIVGILIIAIAIGIISSTLIDSSSYADFEEAFSSPETEYHVVGQLNRDKEMIYDPETNPDLFVFHMNDLDGRNKKVFLHRSKPQDFERSEQIVIIGQAKGDDFHASDILLKCPSKYNDGTPGEFKRPEDMADQG